VLHGGINDKTMNIYQQDDIPEANLAMQPVVPRYVFAPTGSPKDFAIAVANRPNIIIRTLQRLILGFRYYKIPR
jgi:hypothetical protein